MARPSPVLKKFANLRIVLILRLCWGHVHVTHSSSLLLGLDWREDFQNSSPCSEEDLPDYLPLYQILSFFWRRYIHQSRSLSVLHQMRLLVYFILQYITSDHAFFDSCLFPSRFSDKLLLFSKWLIAVLMFAQKCVRVEPTVSIKVLKLDCWDCWCSSSAAPSWKDWAGLKQFIFQAEHVCICHFQSAQTRIFHSVQVLSVSYDLQRSKVEEFKNV